MSFVASLSILQEPKNFSEAFQHEEWREAMTTELQALEANHTWKISPSPPGKSTIGCKWVFKMKLRVNGSVDRYKARLVAKGFNQVEGIDYIDSFSPVAKSVTVRLFLTIAAAQAWPIQQLDVNNAFLHEYIDEDIYMMPPEGYEIAPNMSPHDYCLFTKPSPSSQGPMDLLIYVDNILISGPSLDDIVAIKDYLHQLFTIKDIGDARYFLGLEITRSSLGLYVAQTKYVLDIVQDTGLVKAKPASNLFPSGLKLAAGFDSPITCPDSYGRLQLSQFVNRPCASHWKAAMHIVRYLKGCPSKGLYFQQITLLLSVPTATQTGFRVLIPDVL
ncbi:UNVERIFIED_CONTAM: Retrovirus-related Pol polyprotein from transposon RE1 [Sesamum indicum]